MSKSQIESFVSLNESGVVKMTNEFVWNKINEMPNKCGTYLEIIAFIAGDRKVTAAEGNALSAPIIRALSEGAKSGNLDTSKQVLNQGTQKNNTVYKYPAIAVTPKVKKTWKERCLEAEQALLELQVKYECACNTIDKLQPATEPISYQQTNQLALCSF